MNNDLLDTLTILSFAVALQNLQENEEQSNALKSHLSEQDNVLSEQTEIYLKQIKDDIAEIKAILKKGR